MYVKESDIQWLDETSPHDEFVIDGKRYACTDVLADLRYHRFGWMNDEGIYEDYVYTGWRVQEQAEELVNTIPVVPGTLDPSALCGDISRGDVQSITFLPCKDREWAATLEVCAKTYLCGQMHQSGDKVASGSNRPENRPY